MRAWIQSLFRLLFGNHFFGSVVILSVVAVAISFQITDRRQFANSELHRDVMERWGAPIHQPVPSVRFVESGTVFSSLRSLPLEGQKIEVDAAMSYRKRGLVYFSGFEFTFRGAYRVLNDRERDIDIAFVFPINLERNRVLLSNLAFTVDGEATRIALEETSDKLIWTGPLPARAARDFVITYQGRGLDTFTYALDPSLPVRNFSLDIRISGGDNYDYPAGMLSAGHTEVEGDQVALHWEYPALESGVPMGVVLPSEKSFDTIIATMVRRSWATFILFFAGLVALALAKGRPLKIYESYLAAAAYGFFFVLVAYFAAFMHFYVAYGLSLLIIGTLLVLYLGWVLGPRTRFFVVGLLSSFLGVPTLAIILQGYTGLIYSLEILVGIAALMVLTTRPIFRDVLSQTGLVSQQV